MAHLLENNIGEISTFRQFNQVLSDDVLVTAVLDKLNVNESVRIVAIFQIDELELFPTLVLLELQSLIDV